MSTHGHLVPSDLFGPSASLMRRVVLRRGQPDGWLDGFVPSATDDGDHHGPRDTGDQRGLGMAGGRWPQFAPRAVAAGFRSVHALPMRASLGARGHQRAAAVTGYSPLEHACRTAAGALNSRVVIEQAKGAIAQLYGVDVGEAFELMRSFARRNHCRLSDVAHVLTDPGDVPELTGDSRSPRPLRVHPC